MQSNKEELKNKIIYRASYRGTKEMDTLMIGFVRSIINSQNELQLKVLNDFVNLDDEILKLYKKKESSVNVKDSIMLEIIKKFQKCQV